VVLRRRDKEEKNLILVASGGFGIMEFKQKLDLSDSNFSTRKAYLQGESTLINDYQLSSNAQPELLDQGVESMYFMPIKSGDRILGSLSVVSTTADYFDDRRSALITAFSNEIESLFGSDEQSKNLRESRDELEAQNNELTRLNQALESHYTISQIFSEIGDFNEKAKSALEMLVLLTGADWATFRLPKEATPGLHLAAAAGPAVLQCPPQRVLTESESISTAAFSESRTIVMDDYTAFPSASPVMIAMGVNSQVFVPVRSGERTLGLAICQEIINKHNGVISVESEMSVGTTFRVSIPFAVKDESESKIQASV
jgi:transcriptional regulator with GAF, ATPase, and Fis domain